MIDRLRSLSRASAPVTMVVIGTLWAAHYVWTTERNPDHDDAALALIRPALFVIVPVAILTIAQIVLQALQKRIDETVGLSDFRRVAYIAAVPLFLIGLPILGFLPASILFFVTLSACLGLRQPIVFLGVSLLLAVLILAGFAGLLKINLPLWPEFLQ